MDSLSVSDIKTLEQTRQRLAQLSSSISSLEAQIKGVDPLPHWYVGS